MSTKTRGFASMDPQRRREIASRGGKAAHEQGRAYEFDHKTAVAAAKKAIANRAARLLKSLSLQDDSTTAIGGEE